MLGDYIRHNPKVSARMEESVEVVKWWNNHSYALGLFQKEQKSMFSQKHWALILPVISRWTAFFCSLDRQLHVRKALKITSIKHEDEILDSVGKKADQKNKAQTILERVKDDEYWKELVM